MNFKETFLSLTKYTIPYRYEGTVEHLLPKGLNKDKFGNYFITIGNNSTTLFTCHLDTASQVRMEINHITDGSIIKTDGSTILGGDDKAGVCILMYLIEQKVPGTYYFFIAEEIGLVGSLWALKNNPEYFKQFKRAVAFDRRGKGSINTHQRNITMASSEFAIVLSKKYKKNGMEFRPDQTGGLTDTSVFLEVIPECTNISVGYYNEHTSDEYIDINYCERVAIASARIDWENLPVVRSIYNMRFVKRFESYF